jgi:predicted transcriptional regulator of viral defense system
MVTDNSHLRTIVNEDGAAVLNTKQGTISTLNATGAYIWQALERGEHEEDIVEGLARETGSASDTIRQDVSDFISALQEHGMLLG